MSIYKCSLAFTILHCTNDLSLVAKILFERIIAGEMVGKQVYLLFTDATKVKHRKMDFCFWSN